MKVKRIISAFAAFAMSVSCFAGLTINVNAVEISDEKKVESADYTADTWTGDETDGFEVNNTSKVGTATVGVTAGTGMVFVPGHGGSASSAREGYAIKYFTTDGSEKVTYSDNITVVANLKWQNNNGGDTVYQYFALADSTGADIINIGASGQYGKILINDAIVSEWSDKKDGGNYGWVRSADWEITIDYNTKSGNIDYKIVSYGDSDHTYSGSTTATAGTALAGIKMGQKNTGVASEQITLKDYAVYNEADTAAYADYKVQYKLADTTLIKETTLSGEVGTVVPEAAVDMSDFTEKGTKYICLSNDRTESTTVAAGGTTVVTVTVREARKYTVTLTDSVTKGQLSIAEDAVENEAVTLYYPRYVVSNSKAYINDRTTGQGYGETITPTGEELSISKEITYTAAELKEAVYYKEAEEIEGFTAQDDTARLSNGKGGYIDGEAAVTVTTLTPGTYKILAGGRQTSSSGSSTFTFKAGEEDVYTFTTTGSQAHAASEQFTVKESTAITVTGGAKNYLLDYVLIEKVADVVPEGEIIDLDPWDKTITDQVEDIGGEKFSDLLTKLKIKTVAVTIYDTEETMPELYVGGAKQTVDWSAYTKDGARTFYVQFMAAEEDFAEFGEIKVEYGGKEIFKKTSLAD